MTIRQFSETEACFASLFSTKVSYLIFGGQASLFIRSLEYCPGKKQLKLIDGCSKPEVKPEPVTVGDLLMFPKDTEILIEGYQEDDNSSPEWETPDTVEYHKETNTLEFSKLLDDNQTQILFKAREELYVIMENLRNQDVPDDCITKIFQEVTKDI